MRRLSEYIKEPTKEGRNTTRAERTQDTHTPGLASHHRNLVPILLRRTNPIYHPHGRRTLAPEPPGPGKRAPDSGALAGAQTSCLRGHHTAIFLPSAGPGAKCRTVSERLRQHSRRIVLCVRNLYIMGPYPLTKTSAGGEGRTSLWGTCDPTQQQYAVVQSLSHPTFGSGRGCR